MSGRSIAAIVTGTVPDTVPETVPDVPRTSHPNTRKVILEEHPANAGKILCDASRDDANTRSVLSQPRWSDHKREHSRPGYAAKRLIKTLTIHVKALSTSAAG